MTMPAYLRPMGLYMRSPVQTAPQPDEDGYRSVPSLPLTNTGFDFTAIELAERKIGGGARRRIVTLDELFQRDWPHVLELGATVERLTEPRPRFTGLPLDRPHIMGIVNVTPDSFSDGGCHDTTERAIAHGLALAAEGADILDIGGESTRPGSDPVPVAEELRRVIPVIEGLRAKSEIRISIDTRKAEVMRQAAAAGADILNDVSALTHDPAALETAAATGLPVILMHAQGDPKTMNDNPQYSDLPLDVFDFLAGRIRACERAGIPRAKLCVDPGIGFGKHLHHNVQMMANLALLHGLGVPILLGASRKKMIGQLYDVPKAADRMPGSLATVMTAAAQGIQLMRVHDVAATKQALAVWLASNLGTEPARSAS